MHGIDRQKQCCILIILFTEYSKIDNVILKQGETIELISYNYPKNTYADSRWLISSNEALPIVLKLLDFRLTVGVSFSIGSGSDFSDSNQILKIGTPDVRVDNKTTIVIRESLIWIWFRTNDETTLVAEQTEIVLFKNDYGSEGSSVKIDSLPSASGIKFSVEHGVKGRNLHLTHLRGSLHLWALFLKNLCVFSKLWTK